MIPAHGAQLSVTASSLRIDRSALLTALTGQAVVEIPLSQVTGVRLELPSLLDAGVLTLEGPGTTIAFAPGQAQAAEDARAAIEAAQRGEAPAAVPGLDFIALAVETANADPGSVRRIEVRRIIDGVAVESADWSCTPPPALADGPAEGPPFAELVPALREFIGDLPVVAHDAQFAMMGLRRACLASDIEVPELRYACSLVLARSTGAEGRRPEEIVVAAARQSGSLADVQEAAGFTLGTLSSAHAYPVLRQRQRPVPVAAPQKAARRAPWQSVATPDVIPEANPDADPTGPLFGQHVTLTGDFEPFDKGRLWSAIADLGAGVGKNVTKKTSILVAGTWATKTSKEKRAEELIAQGQDIQIWSGEQLLAVLGLDEEDSEQPPF